MREITVKYELTPEQELRLEKITKLYALHGLVLSEERQFEGIMLYGSSLDIDKKFAFHEQQFDERYN